MRLGKSIKCLLIGETSEKLDLTYIIDLQYQKNKKKQLQTLNINQTPVSQLVASPKADPGVMNSIPAQSHTFVEIDHTIISMAILLQLLIQVEFCQLQAKVCAQILVNCIVQLAQEKCVSG